MEVILPFPFVAASTAEIITASFLGSTDDPLSCNFEPTGADAGYLLVIKMISFPRRTTSTKIKKTVLIPVNINLTARANALSIFYFLMRKNCDELSEEFLRNENLIVK